MTRWLLNSAVLAAGEYGLYRYEAASVVELGEFLRPDPEPVLSRVGYRETAEVIERWTGFLPNLSREPSRMQPGDVAMVVRLRYRVEPSRKGVPEIRADADWEIATLMRLE